MKKKKEKPIKSKIRLVVPPPRMIADRKKQASKDACRKNPE